LWPTIPLPPARLQDCPSLQPPPPKPSGTQSLYVSNDSWAAFKNKSSPSFGELRITVQPDRIEERSSFKVYDEMFVIGFSAFYPDAVLENNEQLFIGLIPSGQMMSRVRIANDPVTGEAQFTEYWFVGAPATDVQTIASQTDASQTVDYSSFYMNPDPVNEPKAGNCDGGNPQAVFSDDHDMGIGDYCTSLAFGSLNEDFELNFALGTNKPFNFASLLASYTLVASVFDTENIDLGDVAHVRIGFWLSTNGVNGAGSNFKERTCSIE